MPAYTFDQILAQGVRAGQIPARTQTARDWFRETASTVKISPQKLMSESKANSRLVTQLQVGRMYSFWYDPKTKAELPYYDRFPLIFPFRKLSDGFMGINMHYLPLVLRARLMDALYDLSRDTRYDENTKLRINYQILNSSARFRWFRPTVKRYLTSHVRSRFLLIDPVEWDIALFLPTERFVKTSKDKVWRQTRKMISGA
jgi:hypothetical protein